MKPVKSPIQRLIEFFDGQTKTAEALSVTQASVSGWANGKYSMSAKTAIKAQRATRGAVMAAELCPELGELTEPAA